MLKRIIGNGLIDTGVITSAAQLPGLQLWLDASQTAFVNDQAVGQWDDMSGNSRHYSQALAGSQPVFKTNIQGGKPIVRFDGTADYLENLSFPTSFTSGEMFVVFKKNVDPAASDITSGAWKFASVTNDVHFPFTDGVIYDNFASSTRNDAIAVNPTPSMSSAFRLYNVVSSATEWTSRLDTTQLNTRGTNTVQWSATSYIGRSHTATYLYPGDIAEFLIYSPVLSSGQRTLLEQYLKTKYTLTGF